MGGFHYDKKMRAIPSWLYFHNKKRDNLTTYCEDCLFCWCDSLGVRTQDPNIKSVVLYLLS